MRRLVVLVMVLAVVATACGDDDASPLFTTTTAATATTVASGEPYPVAVVDAYMEGCTAESGAAFCRCTIDEFQARMTLEEFLAFSEGDFESDPLTTEIIDICLRGGPVTGSTTTTTVGQTATVFATMDDVIDAAIADLEVYWAEEMPAIWGREYQTLEFIGPYYISQGDRPECGGPLGEDSYVGNAFYCGFDDTIQWDVETLMTPLYEDYGDFTVALVLAHEWGHAIQNRYGFDDFASPTIVSELQADCFAGSWTGRVAGNESSIFRLATGDLEEAMSGFLLIGDGLGSAPGGEDAHGGSFDRLNAFFDGLTNGASQCATYEAQPPTVVFVPLVEGDDPFEGGDLPLADAPTILADALEVFWSIVYPETWGGAWTPVSGRVPYQPSTGNFPTCGGFAEDPGFYAGNAFYCEQDDYVAWDAEGLFPSLYTEIGDFAIGLVLANEWGRAVLARRGLPTEGPDAQVQVDCMAGVWTAAMTFDENPMQLYLSAGDLEEGIAGFLALSATPGIEGSVSAFQRYEAFRGGFFDGIGACGVG